MQAEDKLLIPCKQVRSVSAKSLAMEETHEVRADHPLWQICWVWANCVPGQQAGFAGIQQPTPVDLCHRLFASSLSRNPPQLQFALLSFGSRYMPQRSVAFVKGQTRPWCFSALEFLDDEDRKFDDIIDCIYICVVRCTL